MKLGMKINIMYKNLSKIPGFSAISRFLKDFCSKFQVFLGFFKISQIPGFSGFLPKISNSRFFYVFPGIVTTL